jgi:hypothetical protein
MTASLAIPEDELDELEDELELDEELDEELEDELLELEEPVAPPHPAKLTIAKNTAPRPSFFLKHKFFKARMQLHLNKSRYGCYGKSLGKNIAATQGGYAQDHK